MPRPSRLAALLCTLTVLAALGLVGVASAPAGAAVPSAAPKGQATCGAWSGSLSAADKQAIIDTHHASDYVFEGHVDLPAHAGSKAINVKVRVLQVWKGTLTRQSMVTVIFKPGVCRTWTLDHRSHEEYVFFVTRTSRGLVAAGDEPRVVAHTASLISVLGPITDGQGPVPVTFTPTGVAAPKSFLKYAAPGFALLIVGLLGLAVVTGVGRRSA